MTDLSASIVSCIDRIRTILSHARATALRTANAAMVAAYWHIGREIVEEEQRGAVADDRVDTEEHLDILTEAVAARNGWKRILSRCAPPEPSRASNRDAARTANRSR